MLFYGFWLVRILFFLIYLIVYVVWKKLRDLLKYQFPLLENEVSFELKVFLININNAKYIKLLVLGH